MASKGADLPPPPPATNGSSTPPTAQLGDSERPLIVQESAGDNVTSPSTEEIPAAETATLPSTEEIPAAETATLPSTDQVPAEEGEDPSTVDGTSDAITVPPTIEDAIELCYQLRVWVGEELNMLYLGQAQMSERATQMATNLQEFEEWTRRHIDGIEREVTRFNNRLDPIKKDHYYLLEQDKAYQEDEQNFGSFSSKYWELLDRVTNLQEFCEQVEDGNGHFFEENRVNVSNLQRQMNVFETTQQEIQRTLAAMNAREATPTPNVPAAQRPAQPPLADRPPTATPLRPAAAQQNPTTGVPPHRRNPATVTPAQQSTPATADQWMICAWPGNPAFLEWAQPTGEEFPQPPPGFTYFPRQ